MNVLPVIGFLTHFQQSSLKLNKDEVDDVFTVSLDDFCNPHNFRYTQFLNYSLPVFLIKLNNNSDNVIRIWGFTAVATHLFLKAFLLDRYKNEVIFVPKIM